MNTIKIKKMKKRNIFNKLILISLLSLLSLGAYAQAPLVKMAAIGTNGDEVAICFEWPANPSATTVLMDECSIVMWFNDNSGSNVTKTDIQGNWIKSDSVTSTNITNASTFRGIANPDTFAYLEYELTNTPNFGNVTTAGTIDTLFKLKFPTKKFRLFETGTNGQGIPSLDSFMTSWGYLPAVDLRINGVVSAHYLAQSLTNLTLPVELIEFSATALDETVAITWQTASEVNNSHFILERSKEGLTWESITTIPGAGNSNTILSYQHFDLDPFKARSYYRLKQVDFDGEYAYSDVEVVDFDNELNVKVTPNPSRSVLSVNLKRSSGVKTIELSDMKGVILYHKQAGDQTTFNIDVSQHSPGIYILQIMGDHGKVETRKIIKE